VPLLPRRPAPGPSRSPYPSWPCSWLRCWVSTLRLPGALLTDPRGW